MHINKLKLVSFGLGDFKKFTKLIAKLKTSPKFLAMQYFVVS